MNSLAAIVVAGGRGERFASSDELPKQFLMLEGEPVFIWSLKVFCQHPQVETVVLVVLADLLKSFEENVHRHLANYADKVKFVTGGRVRQASVLAGLEYLADRGRPPKFVLIHDAVRPFVDVSDVDKVIAGLEENRGCTLALPISDTLKQVEGDLVTGTLVRQGLYSVQTPQGADFSSLVNAHRFLDRMGIETTDDASVLERMGVQVNIIIGSPRNFKITTAQDFYLAQALAAKLKAEKKVKHYI